MIKRLGIYAVSLALLSGLAWGQPPSKAMVLESSGSAQLKSGRIEEKVLTGQIWREGDSVVVQPNSQLTVLVLGKGERLTIAGPAKVAIGPKGVTVNGGAAKGRTVVQHKLALTGENHRQIGGNSLRDTEPAQALSSKMDSVQISMDAHPVVTLSRKASGTPARPVVVTVESEFVRPDLSQDLRSVVRGKQRRVFATIAAEGVLRGDSAVYEAKLPAGEPGTLLALRVRDEQSGDELLYTRLYYPLPTDRQLVTDARRDAEQWAKKEPNSAAPWLVLAQVLEEKGQLMQARDAVIKALTLRPKDEGLLQMKARLEMDLGDYVNAARSVELARSAKSG
jgi:hypothetical protein